MVEDKVVEYNEMGDGHDEYSILYDSSNMKMSIIHVGRWADEGMLPSTYVRKEG